MSKIITISREFGSGGRELGRRLAEELKIAYYDQEIVSEIAKRTELSEHYIRAVEERQPPFSFPIHIGRSFYPAPNPAWEQHMTVYQEPVSYTHLDVYKRQVEQHIIAVPPYAGIDVKVRVMIAFAVRVVPEVQGHGRSRLFAHQFALLVAHRMAGIVIALDSHAQAGALQLSRINRQDGNTCCLLYTSPL